MFSLSEAGAACPKLWRFQAVRCPVDLPFVAITGQVPTPYPTTSPAGRGALDVGSSSGGAECGGLAIGGLIAFGQLVFQEEIADDARDERPDKDAQLGFVEQFVADVGHGSKGEVGDEERHGEPDAAQDRNAEEGPLRDLRRDRHDARFSRQKGEGEDADGLTHE